MRAKSEHIEIPVSPARPVNYILAAGLTALLCVSFTFMLTSTYSFPIDVPFFVVSILLMALLGTSLHILTEKKKWISVVILLLSVLVPVLAIVLKIAGIREGMDTLLFSLKKYTFRDLPFDFEEAVNAKAVLTRFLLVMNLLPVLFTTYVLARKKSIFLCVPFYLPFLFASVALNYKFPGQIWCELALTGILLLCFFQNLRKGDRVKCDKKLLLLAIPALLLSVLVGMWFPQKNYDKQSLAVSQMRSIRNALQESSFHDMLPKNIQKLIDDVQDTYLGDTTIDGLAMSDPTHENLNAVGDFQPPYAVVMTMTRNRNPAVPTAEGSKYLYIRSSSLDTYSGHAWDISGDEPDEDDIYAWEDGIPKNEASFILSLSSSSKPEYTYSPLYTDGFTISSYETGLERWTDYNVLCLLDEPDEKTVNYALDELPIQKEDVWSSEYYDYLYSTTLAVPEETRRAILESGILPDWYMSLYNGETQMYDVDKIRKVTEFVSKLHPYDEFTTYPPKDEDFVVWFMTKSPTGFCVHYASTAVILLRMLGIPARYCSGYMVNTALDGKPCDVATTDAHAWFEVFLPDYGWVMGDPTPGNDRAASRFDVTGLIRKYDLPTDIPLSDKSGSNNGMGNTETATPTPAPERNSDPTRPSSDNSDSGSTGTKPSSVLPGGDKQNTVDPAEVKSSKKFVVPKWLKSLGKALVPVLIVCAVLALLRFLYVFIWNRAFHQDDVNACARAYFRYFQWVGKKWKGRPATRTRMLALKATFSEEGITKEELDDLISAGKQGLSNTRKKQPWYRRVPVRLLFEVKM